MDKEMTRREFLNTTALTGTVLLAGNILPGISFAQGLVKIPESESITITVLADSYVDAGRADEKIAKRLRRVISPLDTAPHGEHGLAYQIENVVAGKSHCCLFDFGADTEGVMKNMKLLKVDPAKVEALGISHDHWDHQQAFLGIMKANKDRFRHGIPLYVGDPFFVGTFQRLPNGNVISMLGLNRKDVEELGFIKIIEIKEPTPFVPGAYFTGRVEQVTNYEKVPPRFVDKKGNDYVPTTFPGEQAVILNAKGKGLVVLSSCAHRGIVNTVKHAQKITGVEKVYMVMGGFHLTGADPKVIQRTVADIKAIGLQYIIPTHCTGFEAVQAFSREMPDQFILNTVGTKYVITD
jgi:7,8-dihydropterin-6-yl-methyl-4-(beta-D-ribofuranosyl)aminobenzene 5'-phosphate synthase